MINELKRTVRSLHSCWTIRQKGEFDKVFYKDQYGRFSFPIWHYVTVGWKAGCNPCPSFETDTYLAQNPDVKRAADTINPFEHFLLHGRREARGGASYAHWISKYEVAAVEQKGLNEFECNPLISLIIPCYKPDFAMLQECLESVKAQQYQHWEVCISDDASDDPEFSDYLRRLSRYDHRIKYVESKANLGIALNSNAALLLAEGEYIALLDQDDLLSENALYEVVSIINKIPDVKLIYSDEDKIDGNGTRFAPHFKPDWNRDLLYSINYICHLSVYEKGTLDVIGGFREGFDGSQDYDLLLRFIEKIDDKQIQHIPKILYRWRAHKNSTAFVECSKGYTWEAGISALQEHFDRCGQAAKVSPGPKPNSFRVHWQLPTPEPLVSIIIATRDHHDILSTCVNSIIAKTTYKNFEILIVDNQSTCPRTLDYFERMERDDRVRVIQHPHEFNYSAITNAAVKHAKGEYLALVNNDTEVISENWLNEMMGLAARPNTGCVGAKLYYPNDTIQHAGVIVGLGGVAGHSHKYFPRESPGYFCRLILAQNFTAVTAACLVVKKSIFQEVGGFDEKKLKIAFNDVDFCLKVNEYGYNNVWTPWAELYHHESKSRGVEDTPDKVDRFNSEVSVLKLRWQKLLKADPAYNPNLTKDQENFSLTS